jgi:putative spermidine/putrescine transport system ATP-binding protein
VKRDDLREAALLVLKQVSKSYGATAALHGLDFIVPQDRYVSLLGASGSGKTTLLRLIAGFEEPDAGRILLDDARLDGVPTHRRDIGFVFQNFALFPHLSVAENVAFGLKYRADNRVTDADEIRARSNDMLDLVGLKGLGGRAVGAISGGQKQRVALARTLVCEPRVVLLDEPLGALDANLRERMCDELRQIRARLGVSFLHVTGSETEALKMGDEVAVLSGGRISHSAAPTEVFTQPANAETARHLNAYNTFAGRVANGVLETPEGPLRLPRDSKLVEGTTAEMSVRFDRIAVLAPESASDGRMGLPARFITSEFNGSTRLCFFRALDGELIQVLDHLSAPRLPDLDEGSAYELRFDPEDAILHPQRAA